MMKQDASTDLMQALKNLLPLTGFDTDQSLVSRPPIDIKAAEYLRQFYLFSVQDLVVTHDEGDISKFLEQRFLNLLAAAFRAGWTVLTTIVGDKHGVHFYFGLLAEQHCSPTQPDVFEKMLKGLMPGLGIRFDENLKLEDLLNDKPFGGIVSGIPTLKIDNERQRFHLSSIIRALHGESYTLLVLSRPMEESAIVNQIEQLWHVRDQCHTLAKRTRNQESGNSESEHTDHTKSESRTDTTTHSKTHSLNTSLGGSLAQTITMGGGVSAGINFIVKATINTYASVASTIGKTAGIDLGFSATSSHSHASTHGTATTIGKGTSKHWSNGISFSEQNSLALELERIAERHAERMLKANSIGGWETAISFATTSETAREILAGNLLGELAKPTTDSLPPRAYYASLNEIPLLLPGKDGISTIFPCSLASYLTSEELAVIAAPPTQQLPGYELRRIPSFSLTSQRSRTRNSFKLGTVCDHGYPLEGIDWTLDHHELGKHVFVCGLTGTGKTTTVKEIVTKANKPFLILESAKRDYRQLLGVEKFKSSLRVYTVGESSIAPIRMNPFYILPGISPLIHIDYLKAIFNASFSLYGPMPHIIEKCLHTIYSKRGWNLTKGIHPGLTVDNESIDKERYKNKESLHYFPTLWDLRQEIDLYIKHDLQYKGELSDNIRTAILTRIDSLGVGSKGLLFACSDGLDIEELLSYPTVLELEGLPDDDDKAFFVGLILTYISQYRQYNNPALDPFIEQHDEFHHLLVIEEAHRLLKNVSQARTSEMIGNPRGKAVEFFANIISEMRSLGQGVVVVEQIPSKILPDVIKNTHTKIVHRLVAQDDQSLLATSIGLQENEALYLTSLSTGHAVCLKEGMQRPSEIIVEKSIESYRISHDRVRTSIPKTDIETQNSEFEIQIKLGYEAQIVSEKLLCSLIASNDYKTAKNALSSATERFETWAKKKNMYLQLDEINNHLSSRMAGLLFLGLFSLHARTIPGTINIISNLIKKPNDITLAKFHERVSNGWNCHNAQEGLITRIGELTIGRISQEGKDFDRTKTPVIVASYFLLDHNHITNQIVQYVQSKSG